MAKIRFEPNLPVEVALKFSEGKRSPTKLRDASGALRTDVPDEMFYTLCGDDTMYVPLSVAAKITALGIRKLELFSICKTVRNKVTDWEVKRVGDTATAVIPPTQAASDDGPPPNNFDDLPTAIPQPQQQKVNSSKATPSAAVATVPTPVKAQTSNSTHIHHTTYSRVMAAALIAAIDAAREAERYAAVVGFEVEFNTEDIRTMAATLFINAAKDPAFLSQPTQKVNGGTTWPQQ